MITFMTRAYAMKQATVSNVALTLASLGFTAEQAGRALAMTITVDTQALRFSIDGTTPTASLGHFVPTGLAPFRVEGAANCANFKVIRATGVDGAITITLETDLG